MSLVGKPTLQLATRADAGRIARMSRDRIESGLGWSWTAPRVLRSIDDAQTNVVLAKLADEMAGFGVMKYHDEEAHLLLLAVDAAATRRGVASALVEWLEASATVAGLGQVLLEARAGNAAARAFYRSRGYVEIQELPAYYRQREPAVRLAKDLWWTGPVSSRPPAA